MAQAQLTKRLGVVSASLWQNGENQSPNVTLTKSHRKDGEWKHSSVSISSTGGMGTDESSNVPATEAATV